ncbi:MAG: hypothetical protein E6J24_16800, partial [Chloroflexi bacterium]
MSHGEEVLEQRSRWLTETLRRCGVEARRLSDRELAEALRSQLDLSTRLQPIADDQALPDIPQLLAPSGSAEHSGFMEVAGRFARTSVVVSYPATLAAGWLSCLSTSDADLDVALHIAPSSGLVAMRFLERRVAELASTLRVGEERGASVDPYRRAALEAATALRDDLAHGGEVAAHTERLEALLGSRRLQSRRLHFQMRDGLMATLPLCTDSLGAARTLSTSALGATFPFVGSDLAGGSGLLYGIESTARTPVLLDRFALENHNAVVFATSGAGKSFLV